MAKPFANRTREVQLFQQIAKGERAERILLIQGPSGIGKTGLVGRFRQACPPEVRCLSIDLKTMEWGLPTFFDRVCSQWPDAAFERFWDALRGFCSGSVNFSDAKFTGHDNQITVALNVDEQTRRYRLVRLQNAFFADLAAIQQRIVLVMDTFQEAPQELGNWLGGPLCEALADGRLPNVAAVIAGQTVPDPHNITWGDYCEHRILQPIREVAEWHEFAVAVGLEKSLDCIEVMVQLTGGEPRKMQEAIAIVIAASGGGR